MLAATFLMVCLAVAGLLLLPIALYILARIFPLVLAVMLALMLLKACF